ncbi:MAG: anaerobic ribonucleoside-triphosphate reductase [Nanoarchaeota archaeon]
MERTKCEVYSRVVGYIRPVQQWNEGKQAEWADRKTFVVDGKAKAQVVECAA